MFTYRDHHQPSELLVLQAGDHQEEEGKKETKMGRGKIEIKKIENQTNRQVTYSKRRNGIFKKAQELTVLCDAKVSIIMISGSKKLHEYISPNITTKKIYDQYQKALNTDLWITHYERMQESLRKLKDINYKLRREIRQRMGEDLDCLNFAELHDLEQSMESSLNAIRERKLHDIKTKTGTSKKKVTSLEQVNATLLLQLGAKYEDPHYGLVESEPDYDSSITMANGAPAVYPFRLHHPISHQAPAGGFGFHQLRLA